jgi:hypothetical protein
MEIMIGSDVVREYEELGGVNFFRVLLLEDEHLETVRNALEKAAGKHSHLKFRIEAFDKPESAWGSLVEHRGKREKVHLLVIDHDLGNTARDWDGVKFLKAAWEMHPEAFFVFRTGYLPKAWQACAELGQSFARGLIDRQIAPLIKQEGSDSEIIDHFLDKFRALILRRRRRSAKRLVITDRWATFGRSQLEFDKGNAWFLRPVHEEDKRVWCTDDGISDLPEEFEDALIVCVQSKFKDTPLEGGIKDNQGGRGRRGAWYTTYVARRHFRSFWFSRTDDVQIKPATFPILSLDQNTYSCCFNMNLLWLGGRRTGFRPVIKDDKEGTYKLADKPDYLYFPDIQARGGRDLCNRFNALRHLYEHFNAEGFFQDVKGSLAGPAEVKACADHPARGGLGMAPDVEVYLYRRSDPSPWLFYRGTG